MKNTRLAAIIALLLALVMSFTSCAVIDNAQGLIDGSVTLDEILSGDPSDGATPEEPDEPSNPDTPAEPEAPKEGTVSFECRYGTANVIQVNTDLPASIPCTNFLATDNGCSIDQSGY